MAGMLQIITYLLAVYLIVKGIEVIQIGLASSRQNRAGVILLGVLTFCGCVYCASTLVGMQDKQASALSRQPPSTEQ